MGFKAPLLFFFILFITQCCCSSANTELRALMDIKAALDPDDKYLSSWTVKGDPCDVSFEGIGCNEKGQIANISLQGKGLSGKISPTIAGLKHLTGLYLHYNSLYGEMPREIANLTQLTDLYLNMNNLSGEIPPEIANMGSLHGSIPTKLGSLKKLNVLALQSNQLTGAIPASLGDLGTLIRLDLSFNTLFGSIPTKLADAPLLEVLDIRNNSLSGNVPLGIAYLHECKANKPALVHQNISAEKVLIDHRFNPLLSDSGLHNILTIDIVFGALKASAANGYLAPEYTDTGRFTEKSDVYAFGVLVFQVLSGKQKVTGLVRLGAESSCKFQDFIDPNLHGRFFEYEAAKLARIASLCTHDSPIERPSMEQVVQELGNCSSRL